MLRDLLNRQCDADGVLFFPACRKRVSRLKRRMDINALYRRPGTSKRHPGHQVFPYLLRTLEIINIDQGSQFSAQVFVDAVHAKSCKLSMDRRGAWRDNVFVERLWKSIKYEEVFLHAYDTVFAAKSGIAKYIHFYNQERAHSSLGKQTPDEAYAQALINRSDDATTALPGGRTPRWRTLLAPLHAQCLPSLKLFHNRSADPPSQHHFFVLTIGATSGYLLPK